MDAEVVTEICPYCKEVIAIGAKKCKHCGEWLEEDIISDNSEVVYVDNESSDLVGRIFATLFFAGISWLLFYYGSWHLLLKAKIPIIEQYLLSGRLEAQNLIWRSDVIALRINDSYYGFVNDAQFFDSPIIQFGMLGAAITSFFWALNIMIFND